MQKWAMQRTVGDKTKCSSQKQTEGLFGNKRFVKHVSKKSYTNQTRLFFEVLYCYMCSRCSRLRWQMFFGWISQVLCFAHQCKRTQNQMFSLTHCFGRPLWWPGMRWCRSGPGHPGWNRCHRQMGRAQLTPDDLSVSCLAGSPCQWDALGKSIKHY